MKENERDKYFDLVWELQKLLDMRVNVIPFVVGALGIVPKAWKDDWKNWKSVEESRPSRQ